jgi:hypothetical protein
VRLSVFSSTPIVASESDWQLLTGQEEAENRVAVPGGRMFSGKFGSGQFSLAHTGQRIDIILGPSPAVEMKEPALLLAGPWPAVSETMAAASVRWLEGVRFPVIRLGFGAVLLCQTETRDQAYELLKDLLASVVVDPLRMSDLFFRVNWAENSTVRTGLKLNRITNWASVRIAQNLIQVTGEQQMAIVPGRELNAVRLELDNNTDPANNVQFNKDEIVPIFSELLEMARENAEKGERP